MREVDAGQARVLQVGQRVLHGRSQHLEAADVHVLDVVQVVVQVAQVLRRDVNTHR